MTTFSGGSAGSSYEALHPGVALPGVEPYVESSGNLSVLSDGPSYGEVTGGASAPAPSSYAGFKGSSCQRNYFYDVIHVEPPAFSLGAMASDTVLEVTLWNGFMLTSTVDSVSSVDSVGIISRFPGFPSGPPIEVQPLSELTWEFLVQKDVGPATFNSIQYAVTNDGEPSERQLAVSIAGSRSQLWAFTHNWISPCIESLEWLCAVNTAHDGTEHRAALREIPRRVLETELYLTRESARKLDHLTFRRQASYFATPMVPFLTKLSEPASVGDDFLFCDTDGRGFVVGSSVMLLEELESTATVVGIADVQPNGLQLASQMAVAWPKGSSVMPAGSARVLGEIPLVWQTKDFATGQLRMEFQPAFTPGYTPHDEAFDEEYNPQIGLVDSQEVLTHEPDWAGGLSRSFSYENQITDSRTGAIAAHETRQRPERVITHNWLLRNFSEVESFRKFLYRRRGRANPFWAPSWTNDFRSVDRSYAVDDTELEFYDSGFMAFSLQVDYNDPHLQERNNVQIHLKNGHKFRARIVAAEAVDSNVSKIILDRGYEQAFFSRDILRVSWLNYYRLASDVITFEWLCPGVARVTLPMVTCPDSLYDYGYTEGGPA